ncbi:hypothetical protein MLD55_08560 [Alcanivorax sp. MM125-6]|nr:hypothetical protein [Alcanivorax sp. MM125-6]
MTILYALPTRAFFLEGPCGRVTHASGFCTGLLENGEQVTLLAGEGADEFIEGPGVAYQQVGSKGLLWYFSFFKRLFFLNKKNNLCVIRWRPLVPFFLLIIGVFGKTVWLEINTITGLDSKIRLIRWLSKLSIVLSAGFFNIIVVSNKSKRNVERLSWFHREIVVVKNGFIAGPISNLNILTSKRNNFNLIYFGRRQSYYDWDMVYQSVKELKKDMKIDLHVFGFEENEMDDVFFYGAFNQETLVARLAEIENPILILHADNSEVARSGSPMKMFEYAATGIPSIISDSLKEQSGAFSAFTYYAAGDKAEFMDGVKCICKSYSREVERAKVSRGLALKEYTWGASVHNWCNLVSSYK